MATQTGSYDFKAAKQAKLSAEATAAADATTKANDAKKVATNFIATDSSGIMVYDGTNGTHTPTNPGSTTSNVLIDSNSVDIRQGTNVLATFGTSTRVGKQNEANVTITNGEVAVNTPDLQSAVKLSSKQFGQTNIYEGVVYLGGEHGNEEPPTITGFTNDSIKENHITVLSKVSDPTFSAHSALEASNSSGSDAYIEAKVNPYGTPTSRLVASNNSDSTELLVAPSFVTIDTNTVLLNGTVKFNNHDSEVGHYINVTPSDSVIVQTSTSTPLCSIDLTTGVWVIRAALRFPAMGADQHVVYANISATSGSTSYQYRAYTSNTITATTISNILKITSDTTYYLNVYQSSGSDKTFSASYNGIRAVRIV